MTRPPLARETVLLSLLLSSIILLMPSSVAAQHVLTLDSCLQRARQNSVALRLSENALHTVRLTETEVRSAGLPQVKLSAGVSYAPESGRKGYDPAITEGGQASGQIVVQESLFDAGVRGLKRDQIGLDLERLNGAKRAADRDLVYAITTLFIETLRAHREIVLQATGVQQLEEYLALVTQMMHGGAASQTDVLKTRVQLNNARITASTAAQQDALARTTLAEAMGTPDDTAFTVSGSLAVPGDSLGNVPFDTTAGTLELKMAQLVLKKNLLDVEIAKRERWPTLSLSGDAGWLSSVDNLRLPPAERTSGLGYSVGFLLELPLFSWGGIASRIEQQKMAVEAQQLGIEQLNRSLRRDMLALRIQMQNALTRVRSLEGTIRAAEQNYLLTKAKFAAGGTLSLEVLSAQQLLAESRLSELQALAEWQTLNAKLQQLLTR